ncbi:MAG: hypothetical protein QM784_08885 [Polyangiaceae bacterium]
MTHFSDESAHDTSRSVHYSNGVAHYNSIEGALLERSRALHATQVVLLERSRALHATEVVLLERSRALHATEVVLLERGRALQFGGRLTAASSSLTYPGVELNRKNGIDF